MKGTSTEAIPTPVSSIVIAAWSPRRSSPIETVPPRGVYLMALVTMLRSSCRRRFGSPDTVNASVPSRRTPIPADSPRIVVVSIISATRGSIATGSRCRSNRPSSARARVRSASTRSAIRAVFARASSSGASCSAGTLGSCIARSRFARRTVNGVLSSWLASAVKRRSEANEASSRSSIALIVSPSRSTSSASPSMATRRWSERPCWIASSCRANRSRGRSPDPSTLKARIAVTRMRSGIATRLEAKPSSRTSESPSAGIPTATRTGTPARLSVVKRTRTYNRATSSWTKAAGRSGLKSPVIAWTNVSRSRRPREATEALR